MGSFFFHSPSIHGTESMYNVVVVAVLPLLNCDLCVYAEKLDLCLQDSSFRSFARWLAIVFFACLSVSIKQMKNCHMRFTPDALCRFYFTHRISLCASHFGFPNVHLIGVCVCVCFRRERFMLAIKKLYCSIRSLARAH